MTERELIRRLQSNPVPPPPEDLAARIINDIPPEIDLHPEIEFEGHRMRFHRRPVWMAAAAIVTVALTGAVTWELRRERPSIDMVTAARPQQEAFGLNEVAGSRQAQAETRGQETSGRQDKDGIDQGTRDLAISENESGVEETLDPATGKGRREQAVGVTQPVVIADDSPDGEPSPRLYSRLDQPASAGLDGRGASKPSPPQRRKLEIVADSPLVDTSTYPSGAEEVAVGAMRESQSKRSAIAAEKSRIAGYPDSTRNLPADQEFNDVVEVEMPATPAQHQIKKSKDEGAVVQPSTGGTAEPNEQPYGDVFFEHTGVNPFIDTEDDSLSTFGLDVDTGSFTIARQYLNRGHLPPRAAIRIEEFVNAFNYGDDPPRKDDFRLIVEGAPSVFASSDRTYTLRLAVKAREIDAADRPPAVLVFCIDVSGSMDRENRLGLVKKALYELLGSLRRDDHVGLVVYGSSGRVVLKPTTDHEKIRRAIESLSAGGSTNAEEGLVLAYDLLSDGDKDGRIRRVILCSDGVANVGQTGPDAILKRIRLEAGEGIELTSVGFGMGNYNDVLMERLADAGDGRYAYVDEIGEARRIFTEELTGTLLTLGHDAKAQVEFDPDVVSRYRLLGYENRDIADHLFRDPTVDAGEIGAGHTVTAVYEVKLRPEAGRRGQVATLRLRYRPMGGDGEVELDETLRVSQLAQDWEDASPALRLASIVAEFAEILKGAYWAKDGDLDIVLKRLQRLQAEPFEGDKRVAELVAMVARAQALSGD